MKHGVVPTDIAAKLAAEKIENPTTHLKIAYATEGGASRGTLFTVLKDITKVGIRVKNGEEVSTPPAVSSLNFKMGGKSFKAVNNPWRADLFTAQLSTGVPNIETYSVFPNFIVRMMKGKLGWLRNLLLNYVINWLPEGPSPKALQNGKTYVTVIAKNSNQSAVVNISGPEAYLFTGECIAALVKELSKERTPKGFVTPSTFGKSLIEGIDKVKIEVV